MTGPTFTRVQLFVDISRKSENSRKIVNYLDKNIKIINHGGLIVEIIPIQSSDDKKVLVENGVKKLPTLLVEKNKQIVGLTDIIEFLGKTNKSRPPKKTEKDELREEQLAEMDMEKFQNGEYNDDDNYDEDDVFAGDRDAVKQNIQRRVSEFNKARKNRLENDPKAVKKAGKRNRKRQQAVVQMEHDDNYEDNVAPMKRKPTTDVNFDDWDVETQQLLDKGGAD